MAQKKSKKQPTATVVLGAGAPNSPLMSGFLAAVYESGKTFNNFFTAGGGGLIGLSLVAPRLDDPVENVKGILNCAVDDAIYKRLPVNYKVFRKNSPLLPVMQRMFNMFKVPGAAIPSERGRRLWNDLVDLGAVMATPGGIPRGSDRSVCAPFALLPQVVDFEKMKDFTGQYYLNAYNMTTGEIEVFDKDEMDVKHFIAALSYPFIYPPGEIDGEMYYEGADIDPLCIFQLMDLMQHDKHRHNFPTGHTIIMVDILGSLERAIVRPSRGLWDAFGISMLTSIVACARWSKAMFRERHMAGHHKAQLPTDHHKIGHNDGSSLEYDIVVNPYEKADVHNVHKLFEMRFDVPETHWPKMTDWSYSNLSLCYKIGHETGTQWIEDHGDLLPDREPDSVNVLGTTPAAATA